VAAHGHSRTIGSQRFPPDTWPQPSKRFRRSSRVDHGRGTGEVFQRLVTSTFLIPTPGSDALDVRIAGMWDSLVASPAAAGRHRTAGRPAAKPGAPR